MFSQAGARADISTAAFWGIHIEKDGRAFTEPIDLSMSCFGYNRGMVEAEKEHGTYTPYMLLSFSAEGLKDGDVFERRMHGAHLDSCRISAKVQGRPYDFTVNYPYGSSGPLVCADTPIEEWKAVFVIAKYFLLLSRLRRALLVCVLASLITLPLATLFAPVIPGGVIGREIIIVLVEALMYRFLGGVTVKQALVLSFAANLCSFLFGETVFSLVAFVARQFGFRYGSGYWAPSFLQG